MRLVRSLSDGREFITMLGGAVAWPLAARAQQRAVPVIGVLSSRSPAVDTSLIAVIRQGLKEAGFVEGELSIVPTLGRVAHF